MTNLASNNLPWLILSLIVILVVIAGTIYAFNRRRYIDSGPRKGEAAKPQKVRRDNPQDRPS